MFCLRYLPFKQALRVPILIGKIRTGELHRGDIVLREDVSRGSIVLGMEGSEGRGSKPFFIAAHNCGRIVLGNDLTMAVGTAVVADGATVTIGNGFFCNADCNIYASRDITIGNHCLFGWNVELNTTDGHRIVYDGNEKLHDGPITLGSHVWLASYTRVGKSVYIADGCVAAQMSLVNKSHSVPNTLVGGVPARDLKTNISWQA